VRRGRCAEPLPKSTAKADGSAAPREEDRSRNRLYLEKLDLARISPLVFDHINLLGRYSFSLPDSVQRGQLRPLRNPSEATEEAAT
jgi:hypothetical protein